MKKRFPLSLAAGAVLLATLASPGEAPGGGAAERIASWTGLNGGLAVLPRADAAEALDLASGGGWVVLAQTADAATAAALRQQTFAAGRLGRTLYVEEAPDAPARVADGFADLVWAQGLTDADLTPERRADWLRALAPGAGVLVAGGGATVGPARDALQRWIAAVPGARVVEADGGLWAVARRPAVEGSEGWTHRAQGPGNNLLSRDAALRMPLMTAWYGLPLHYGFWGGTVVAGNGRIFPLLEARGGGPTLLMARRISNGLILWQRTYSAEKTIGKFRSGLHSGRSAIVVDGDALWLVDGDGVARVDGETGRTLSRVTGPQPGGQVRWIAVADGFLAVMAGEPDREFSVIHHAVPAKPFGRALAVYRTADGAPAWTRTEEGDVDERMLALEGGRIVYHVAGVGAFCRALADGREVWSNRDADTVARIDGRSVTGAAINQTLASNASLVATPEAVIIGQSWHTEVVVLDAKTGTTRWTVPAPTFKAGRALDFVAIGDALHTARGVFDLATGAKGAAPSMPHDGCGITAAVNGLFVGCFGTISDIATGRTLRFNDVKSACDIGGIVAEGHIVNPGVECRCGVKIMGYRALVSAPEGFDPHAAAPAADALHRASGGDRVSALATDASDWTTFLHDAARSGSTPAAVGSKAPALLWRTPAPPPAPAAPAVLETPRGPVFVPTAPVAAGDLAWYGDAAGVVRGVALADGAERWSFPTGAKLFAPPTVGDGRVFVGGGDGRIYALEATTGRLLWRFDAAPRPWKMCWYGHLVSAWPMTGGVVLHGGTLYAVAGYQDNNGLHAYALDPATGAVRWSRHDAGRGVDGVSGTASSLGTIAVGGGRLWIASATIAPASFDLKTGELLLPAGGEATLWGGALKRGTAVATAGGAWVLQGGRRLSASQEDPPADENFEGLMAWPVGAMSRAAAPGTDRAVGVELIGDGLTFAPASDGDLLVAAGRGNPVAYSWKALEEAATRAAAGAAAPGNPRDRARFVPATLLADRKKGALPEGARWGPLPDRRTEAAVIAADAVVCAAAVLRPGSGRNTPATNWTLAAHDRATGAETWSVPLPGRPVADGLCIARDGRLLISLADGSLICYGQPSQPGNRR